MAWRVTVSRKARRDLASIPDADRDRVLAALARLPTEFGELDTKKLEGGGNSWRLRVGRWRVLMELDNAAGLIRVARVVSRDRAY